MTIPLLIVFILLALAVGFFGGAYLGKRTGSIPFISRPERWAIGLYAGASPLDLAPSGAVANPILTAADVTDRAADFVADPFMIRAGEAWYLFFEVVDRRIKRGEIALATSVDGVRWVYEQVVLSEPFHLSYPCVFQWEGTYYMIPESNQAAAVRLYEAVDFPFAWKPVANLLFGTYHDATVFRHEGTWWMFASDWHSTLHLFYAERLEGPWTEHPASPVVRDDARIARPAGRVIAHEGRLIRFAQDCVGGYGRQVHAFAITELTKTRYAECKAAGNPVLTGSGAGWNKQRMHHVDAHAVAAGHWIACVDGDAGQKLVFSLP